MLRALADNRITAVEIRDNRVNVAVMTALLLWALSVAVLFLAYSNWWNRVFEPESTSASIWPDGFLRLSWLRSPAIWCICSVLYGLAMGCTREVVGYVVLFPVIYLLTYPGLTALHLGSDRSSNIWLTLLTAIHCMGAYFVYELTASPTEDRVLRDT